jgi:hypothetical protein
VIWQLGWWMLSWVRRLRADLWLIGLVRWMASQVVWWVSLLGSESRRAKLVEAIRETAQASRRIVALIASAVDAESDGPRRRVVLVLIVLTGVIWSAFSASLGDLIGRGRSDPPGPDDRRD